MKKLLLVLSLPGLVAPFLAHALSRPVDAAAVATRSVVSVSAPFDGVRTITVAFDPAVWDAQAGVIHEETLTAVVSPRGQYKVGRVWCFLGVDQGNAGEYAIDVFLPGGRRLYQRSLHKEAPYAIYDAWDVKDIAPTKVTELTVHLLAHATATPPGHVQFELILETVP